MFYQGSLQEGISTAVGQQKLVLCFVTNENDESRTWEHEFLQDDSLRELIETKSIALRLIAESEETGYLSQIFPLPKTPTVVIMKEGELKEYIAAGTSKDDFIRRVRTAFNAPTDASSAPSPSSSSSPRAQPAAAHTSAPTEAASSQQTAFAQPRHSDLPAAAQSESVSRVLAERAARLKAAKEEAERKAKEERAKAQEKAKAEAEIGANTDAARVHRQSEELKKKRQKESEERQRILKRIADDKAERQMRASTRERQRIDSQTVGDVAASLATVPETQLPSTTRISDMASLQVRLFDGSTIRSRFKTASPLKAVRTWVDENRGDNKVPYTFKQLLTPLPNKNIDETEEDKALGELGLVPSSTLVLIPVLKFSSAYDGGSRNIFSRILGLFLGFFSWLLGLVGIGGGRRAEQGLDYEDLNNDTSATTAQASKDRDSRIRGLQNLADGQRDHQLYNGNSLNFEPRHDDDEK